MELLTGLGVNQTVGIQFVIFLATYFVLHFVLFRPYFAAFKARVANTMGQTEQAERYIAETHELQYKYETKARQLSNEYKAIYDKSRAEAMKEYDRLVGEARQGARAAYDASKDRIDEGMRQARQDIRKEIPAVATEITGRLLGKEART